MRNEQNPFTCCIHNYGAVSQFVLLLRQFVGIHFMQAHHEGKFWKEEH